MSALPISIYDDRTAVANLRSNDKIAFQVAVDTALNAMRRVNSGGCGELWQGYDRFKGMAQVAVYMATIEDVLLGRREQAIDATRLTRFRRQHDDANSAQFEHAFDWMRHRLGALRDANLPGGALRHALVSCGATFRPAGVNAFWAAVENDLGAGVLL